jgi:hypothetical protein
MDITGGTQNSGGCWSPPNSKNKGSVVYDPRFHRWQKTQVIGGLHARTISAPMQVPNQRYHNVRDFDILIK